MELTSDGRCPKCKTPLEEVRGEYHCPSCTFEKLLTHKRYGGLKLGHNLTTALRTRMSMKDMPMEKCELDDLVNTRYKAE